MKRQIIFTPSIFTIILSLILSGCGASRYGKYHVYEAEFSDSAFGVEHRQEYSLNFGDTRTNEKAPQEASVTFLDMSFSGIYKWSMTSDLFPHEIHAYMTDDRTMFWLDAKTGELRYLDRIGIYNKTIHQEQFLTQDECASLAEDFLSQVIDDFNEYTCIESNSDSLGDVTMYSFEYCRQIGGLNSMDTVKVGFHSTGELALYDIRQYGTLKGVKLPSSYDKAEVRSSVQAKMDDVYASLKEEAQVDFSEESRQVVKLRNGSIGLIVTMDASILRSGEGTGLPYSEMTQVIVVLD